MISVQHDGSGDSDVASNRNWAGKRYVSAQTTMNECKPLLDLDSSERQQGVGPVGQKVNNRGKWMPQESLALYKCNPHRGPRYERIMKQGKKHEPWLQAKVLPPARDRGTLHQKDILS